LATQGSAYSGSLAGTATDVDPGDSLEFAKLSGPAWLTVDPDGSLSGTPQSDDVGSNAFVVEVTDSGNLSDTTTLLITVQDVNDPPFFTADPIVAADATEDSPYSASLVGFADDPDNGDTLTFAKVSGPAWLSVAPGGSLSGTPLEADNGINSFVVRVTDLAGASAQAVLNLVVIGVNDPPEFSSELLTRPEAKEEEPYSGQTLAGSASDPDVGDSLTFTKVSGPDWLTVAPDGALGGTPPEGSSGTNTFVVRATDLEGLSDEASLEIEVVLPAIPMPWEESQIGIGTPVGPGSFAGGVFSVGGSGAISRSYDSFRFIWQEFEGDAEIVARVSEFENTGPDARVGIMVRDSLAENSRNVFFGVNGDGEFRWTRRTTAGGNTALSRSGSSEPGSAWLKLTRTGGLIGVYKSADGVNWIRLGSMSAFLPSTCYFGLAVASGSNEVLNMSKFSDVSVTP
jgi:hypothetical protein